MDEQNLPTIVTQNSAEPAPRGFKRIDLMIAYRALIDSFVHSDQMDLAPNPDEPPTEEMYDNW